MTADRQLHSHPHLGYKRAMAICRWVACLILTATYAVALKTHADAQSGAAQPTDSARPGDTNQKSESTPSTDSVPQATPDQKPESAANPDAAQPTAPEQKPEAAASTDAAKADSNESSSLDWNWRSQEVIGRTDASIGNTSKLTEPERTALIDAIVLRLQKPMSEAGYDDQRIREIASTTRVRFIDLGDGKPVLFTTLLGLEGGCDALGTCPLWIFRRDKDGFLSLLDAVATSYTIQPTSSNGLSDVVLMHHISAKESGLVLYKYADGKYSDAGCFVALWPTPSGEDQAPSDPAIQLCKEEAGQARTPAAEVKSEVKSEDKSEIKPETPEIKQEPSEAKPTTAEPAANEAKPETLPANPERQGNAEPSQVQPAAPQAEQPAPEPQAGEPKQEAPQGNEAQPQAQPAAPQAKQPAPEPQAGEPKQEAPQGNEAQPQAQPAAPQAEQPAPEPQAGEPKQEAPQGNEAQPQAQPAAPQAEQQAPETPPSSSQDTTPK